MRDAATPILGALAVVCHQDRVILVQRRNPPSAGMWGFPGGHVELGETAMQAAARELAEETGVTARPLEYLTNVDVLMSDDSGTVTRQYLLTAVLCEYVSGTPAPDDDALQAEWLSVDDLAASALPLLDQVLEVARLAQARCRSLRPEVSAAST